MGRVEKNARNDPNSWPPRWHRKNGPWHPPFALHVAWNPCSTITGSYQRHGLTRLAPTILTTWDKPTTLRRNGGRGRSTSARKSFSRDRPKTLGGKQTPILTSHRPSQERSLKTKALGAAPTRRRKTLHVGRNLGRKPTRRKLASLEGRIFYPFHRPFPRITTLELPCCPTSAGNDRRIPTRKTLRKEPLGKESSPLSGPSLKNCSSRSSPHPSETRTLKEKRTKTP